jgi:hypothetical protein
MQKPEQSTFELLDFIGKTLTEILQEEGLLLPGTADKVLRAKDAVNKLKSKEGRKIE